MKTGQKIVNNLINKNIFTLKVSSLSKHTHLTYKILQYICFSWAYYTCSYDKWVWDMSQHNKTNRFSICKISDIGCAPACWTVSVSWYPYCVILGWNSPNRKKVIHLQGILPLLSMRKVMSYWYLAKVLVLNPKYIVYLFHFWHDISVYEIEHEYWYKSWGHVVN